MEEIKKGSIIRPKGGLGRYVKVTDVIDKDTIFGVYMSKIGNISEETRIPSGMYDVLRVYRLSVSAEEFERIQKYATSIKHEATKSWDSFIDELEEHGVDLIMFYNKSKKLYCTFHGVSRVYSLMWNKQRTICKKTPCVTISLGTIIAAE